MMSMGMGDVSSEKLRAFLAAPERPADTLHYHELQGFLFAIASSPELIRPSEWLPLIFNDQEASYASMEEAQEILQAIMALYNQINQEVFEGRPQLPADCRPAGVPLDNLVPDAPLGQWSQGFMLGHRYLERLWDEYTPEELDNELGGSLLALSFFANRKLAESYRKEVGRKGQSLESMAESMIELIPRAMQSYAHLGRSIYQVLHQAEHQAPIEPARSDKTGRNDPCPCGSGKKFKKCCMH